MKRNLTGYYKGLIAEYICMMYVMFRGHRIVARRVKTPVGEIDILTRRRNTFYAIEVKYRSGSLSEAKTAVLQSRKRVRMAYKWWMGGPEYKWSARDKSAVEFKYFACSGFKFEVGAM